MADKKSKKKALKVAAVAVPLVAGFTLAGAQFASAGGGKGHRPHYSHLGPYEGEYQGQGTHGDSSILWWGK